MEQTFSLWMVLGFLFAAYSVVANDSVQTLGTWMASNQNKFKWYYLWAAATVVLWFTIWWGWSKNGGDISYGRLNKIPFQEIQWYHATAPLILLLLTRVGIPVSTSFLVLSAFASTFVLEKMLVKSIIGYALAAVVAYAAWQIIERIIDEKKNQISDKNKTRWRVAQWCSTAFLWYTWLSHDMANIAVFLPRAVPVEWMVLISVVFAAFLGYTFWEKGGKIQKIVVEKTGTRFVRSATLIDLVYAFILLFFKQYNDIPMSTTWVFVGLLCGRELAISTLMKDYKFKYVFPIVAKDFAKMMLGLLVSVGIVLTIHYVIVPNGL
jgi:phosphate/sulfate permease